MRQTKKFSETSSGATAEISAGEARHSQGESLSFCLPKCQSLHWVVCFLDIGFHLSPLFLSLSSLTLEKAWGLIEKLLDEHPPVLEKPPYVLIQTTYSLNKSASIWHSTEPSESGCGKLQRRGKQERKEEETRALLGKWLYSKDGGLEHRGGSYKQGHKRLELLTSWSRTLRTQTDEFLEELQPVSLTGFKRHVGPTKL